MPLEAWYNLIRFLTCYFAAVEIEPLGLDTDKTGVPHFTIFNLHSINMICIVMDRCLTPTIMLFKVALKDYSL